MQHAMGIILRIIYSRKNSEYMHIYDWVLSLFIWYPHNIVNQLYLNAKLKKKTSKKAEKVGKEAYQYGSLKQPLHHIIDINVKGLKILRAFLFTMLFESNWTST